MFFFCYFWTFCLRNFALNRIGPKTSFSLWSAQLFRSFFCSPVYCCCCLACGGVSFCFVYDGFHCWQFGIAFRFTSKMFNPNFFVSIDSKLSLLNIRMPLYSPSRSIIILFHQVTLLDVCMRFVVLLLLLLLF